MMKKHLLILSLAAAGSMFAACNEQSEVENLTNQEVTSLAEGYRAPSFAEPDNAKQLTGSPAENLKAIFSATGPKIITSMGRTNITDAQYKEIAEFTDNLVKGMTSQTDKYRTIFKWIATNVKFNNQTNNPNNKEYSNDPYDVFKNKICVCQGYSNLLIVMCHSQGIPAVVVNGLGWGLGHAWAYTCPDGVWEVSDPTNTGSFPMNDTGKYTHLTPSEADVDLFADNFAVYRYYGYNINVDRVTATNNPLVVPYSAGGFVITSFNPSVELPEHITEIYLGENITTLGEVYNMTLLTEGFGKNIQAIYVDKNNQRMLDHKGILYRKNGDEKQLYYIPGGMEYVELLPMEKVEKNTIYKHDNVKVIYFPEGTKEIESYAIENCPKLERVYVPEDANVSRNALYDCPRNVEIIRGVPSSIKHVTM